MRTGIRILRQKPTTVSPSSSSSPQPQLQPQRKEPEQHALNVVRRGYFASGHVLINSERQKRDLPPLNRSRSLDIVARKEAEQLAKQLGGQSLAALTKSQQEEQEKQNVILETTTTSQQPERQDSKEQTVPSSSASTSSPAMKANERNDDKGATCLRELLSSANSFSSSSKRLVENITVGESIHRVHFTAMRSNGGGSSITSHKALRRNILSKSFTELGFATAKGENGLLYVVQLFRGENRPTEHVISQD